LVTASIATGTTPLAALDAPENTYVQGTVSDGVPSPSSALSASDCALVVQMTGTVANGLGVYEILDPATATPKRTYSSTEAVQYVVLPGGCDQEIEVDATYTPPAWDPASGTGGVVFLGGSTLSLNADIDASAAGFASGHSVGAGCDGGDGDWGPDGSMWEGGAGGGGFFGGGGGAAGHVGNLDTWALDHEFDASPGGGGTATAAGAGAPNGDGLGFAPSGGDANCVGNGGSPDLDVVAGAFYTTGAGAGGGGSYGGGGAACSSRSSGAYSAGGGGGGSYTGGGAGGWGGTNTGWVAANDPGIAGNAPTAATITDESHYLNDTDARLVMGGAGGASFRGDGSTGSLDGGRGGGIVVLAFDSIVGGGGNVLSNGGAGATPPNFSGEGSHGSSGSGGGAGGQMAIYAPSVADTNFTASGGIGGLAIEGSSSNAQKHTGSAGASGGGGGIWFAGVGADVTNTGPNNGETSATAPLDAPGLSNVDWVVSGGNPSLDSFPAPVTIGGSTYTFAQWSEIVGLANLDSQATFKPISQSLVDASSGGFTLDQLVTAYPYFIQPDNPKNIGLGCGPGFGGSGLAVASTDIPTSTTCAVVTDEEPADEEPADEEPADEEPVDEELFALGNQVWMDSNNDGIIDAAEMPVAGVAVHLFDADDTGAVVDANNDGVIDAADAIATAITNDEGHYLFDELAAGDYVVAVAPEAFAADGPLADKVSSTTTSTDPNNDVDLDDNGTLDATSGYVMSGPVTLAAGEPTGEDPANSPDTADESDNLTVDFGFFVPAPSLDLEVDLDPAAVGETVDTGDEITIFKTVVNDGNVTMINVGLTSELPAGMEIADDDWAIQAADVVELVVPGPIYPGEEVVVEMTAVLTGEEDMAIDAGITGAQPVDENLVPLSAVLSAGAFERPAPFDAGEALNGVATPVAQAPATPAVAAQTTAPPVLAFTGVESHHVVFMATLLLGVGLALVAAQRRLLESSESNE